MLILPQSFELVNVSPLDHMPRSLFYLFFGAYFGVLALKFLKNIKTGVTLLYSPTRPFSSIKVVRGKSKTAPKGLISSYDSPLVTAILGLVLFAASELLLVMMFKRIDYVF